LRITRRLSGSVMLPPSSSGDQAGIKTNTTLEKVETHCVKVEVLVTANEQCVHLSKIYRGSPGDKAIFHRSGLSEFLSYRRPALSAPF
jgi:hypothetical protein